MGTQTTGQATARTKTFVTFEYGPPRSCAGVYAIRNRATGRVYVSGDADVQDAIDRDRLDLQRERHRNAALQADWNWFGEENFSFDVIDIVEPERPGFDRRSGLTRLLESWREELRSYGDTGYNSRVTVAF